MHRAQPGPLHAWLEVRQLLTAALLLAGSCALAAQPRWVRIETTTPSTVYVDTLSAGDGPWRARKVWIRREHPPGLRGNIQSDKVLYIFDCERSTFAVKDIINYEQHEGRGAPISSTLLTEEQLKFADVLPSSVSEGLAVIACRK